MIAQKAKKKTKDDKIPSESALLELAKASPPVPPSKRDLKDMFRFLVSGRQGWT